MLTPESRVVSIIIFRVFWILAFVMSIIIWTLLTVNTWRKWSNNPVFVSFAEEPTPVWEVPFPAVTICSESKYREDVFKYSEAVSKFYNNMTLTADE